MKHVPIIIIGAGPAGLSLAHELEQLGIEYLILEKASVVGATFYHMTDSTEYGPWINNVLPGSPLPKSKLLTRTTRGRYARYLSEYRHHHKLKVQTETSVLGVAKTEDGYEVETDQEILSCRFLVNATGYFSTPFIPPYEGLSTSKIATLHSAQYISPETIRQKAGPEGRKVLIVGCRLSAGEIMEELYKVGFHLHLSHRGKMKYWPSPWEEAFISPFTMLWERIALKIKAPRPKNLKPRLRRGFQKSLLDDGKVPMHPDIQSISGQTVEFVDGSKEDFDVILFATGYRPTLGHLWSLFGEEKPKVKKLESKEHENVFLLGYENARSFRSQFLRGIREDATYLSEVLRDRYHQGEIKHKKKPQPQIEVQIEAGAEELKPN